MIPTHFLFDPSTGEYAPPKTCDWCEETYAETMFRETRKGSGKRLNICLQCYRAYHRQRAREAAATPEGRRKRRESVQRYMDRHRERVLACARASRQRQLQRDPDLYKKQRAKNPERVAARLELRNAVRRGDVAKPDRCSQCGERGKTQGHHHDYTKPLDVTWLCSWCHGLEHRKVG